MKAINATIAMLGLLASIMALSSLVYGAFQEPLLPFMQGVMGGALESYNQLRDTFFSGLGSVVANLINWIGMHLAWLPSAPWFTLPPIIKDLFSLHILFGVAFFGWFYRVAISPRIKALEKDSKKPFLWAALTNPKTISTTLYDFAVLIALFPIWPIILIEVFDWKFRPSKYLGTYRGKTVIDGKEASVYEGFPDSWLFKIPGFGERWMIEAFMRSDAVVRFTLFRASYLIIGTLCFLLLAYAENKIGL